MPCSATNFSKGREGTVRRSVLREGGGHLDITGLVASAPLLS